VKGKPYAEAERTAEAQAIAARFKAAQEAAAKGGWPEGAMCSMAQLDKPRITIWAWTVATFFGAGLGKPGPGTWGSVAATLIFAGTAFYLHPSQQTLLILTLAGIALSIALGVPAATIAAREAGREDPGFVVIDEVAGVWIALLPLAIPALAAGKLDWQHIFLALLLFRLFDIWKPYPIRKLENLPEGWGIVFDDVAAGLYAGAVLLVIMHWF
jgi:phosphatidylglycerophosphatase A